MQERGAFQYIRITTTIEALRKKLSTCVSMVRQGYLEHKAFHAVCDVIKSGPLCACAVVCSQPHTQRGVTCHLLYPCIDCCFSCKENNM